MNDFQTINEIVNESVRNSSYYTVAISSCVFILYTLIVNLISYFKSKSKNKPLLEMSKAMKEMTENIVKLNAVLDKTFKEAERKEQMNTNKSEWEILEEEHIKAKTALFKRLTYQVNNYDLGIRLIVDAMEHIRNAIEDVAEAMEAQNEQG